MKSLTKQALEAINRIEVLKKDAVPKISAKAINAIGVKTERETAKSVAKSEDVPQKAIRNRIKPISRASPKNPARQVSLRLRPLSATSIGKVRQTRRGVSVRKHRFDGHFIADGSKGYGKYKSGARRSYGGIKQDRRTRYHSTSLNHQHVLHRTTSRRYPIDVTKIAIEKPIVDSYQDSVKKAYRQDLTTQMATEIAKEIARINRMNNAAK